MYVHCKELAHVVRGAGSPTISLPAVCELQTRESRWEDPVEGRRRRTFQLPMALSDNPTHFCSPGPLREEGRPTPWGQRLLGSLY